MSIYDTNVHQAATTSARRVGFWNWVMAALAVRRQRLDLADLDPHLLNDIGLTREAAEREVKRKIWDVPQHWLQ